MTPEISRTDARITSMSKWFNTAGPCQGDIHYMLPPIARLPQLTQLIEQRGYFVIHAPRQTGKTTAMMALAQNLPPAAATPPSCCLPKWARPFPMTPIKPKQQFLKIGGIWCNGIRSPFQFTSPRRTHHHIHSSDSGGKDNYGNSRLNSASLHQLLLQAGYKNIFCPTQPAKRCAIPVPSKCRSSVACMAVFAWESTAQINKNLGKFPLPQERLTVLTS